MRKIILYLTILFMPLCAWALKPVADADLSKVSTPASLSGKSIPSVRQSDHKETARTKNSSKKEKASFFSILWNENEIGLEDSKIMANDTATAGSAAPSRNAAMIDDSQTDSAHNISYTQGQTTKSEAPITVTVRPGGGTELRTYYTGQTTSNVMPRSWVDVKSR